MHWQCNFLRFEFRIRPCRETESERKMRKKNEYFCCKIDLRLHCNFLSIGFYFKVQRVFSVRPAMQVAMASINVAKPMLACTGIIALRHPYVAFSQQRHTKNLSITPTNHTHAQKLNILVDYFRCFSKLKCQFKLSAESTHVKNPNTNCSAKSPIVTKPIHECRV